MSLKQTYLMRFFSLRFLAGACLLFTFLLGYWHWLSYQTFLKTPLSFDLQQKTITIKQGDNVNRLARYWQDQGLIKNVYYLKLLCFFQPEFEKIRVGEYLLSEQETPVSLMLKLSQGQVVQYPFTIIEGMTSWQVLHAIKAEQGLVNSLDPDSELDNSELDINSEKLLKILDIKEASIEGWLYPDTYHYNRESSAINLLKRSVQKMQQVLQQEWQGRAENLPYQSAYEALIMASIIEKETALDSEREMIAGVFVRRLQKKMRLQTDPTVIYGLGENFNGNITRKDLKTKTAYNTYIIKGLPPTPIAMPSRRSIYAALHPADGDALYFVANGQGGHYFSSTIGEHNQAVKNYLKQLRKQRK